MRFNSASKNLINVFGKISDLNLESDKLLNIYKIPTHYEKYKRLTLYFGDWRRVEADCLYLRNRREFETLLVQSKMANFKVPYNLSLYDNINSNMSNNTTIGGGSSNRDSKYDGNRDSMNKDNQKNKENTKEMRNRSSNLTKKQMELDKDNQLVECSDFVKNCKFIYFGNLNKFVPNKHLKSLIIPLDLFSDYYDLDPNYYYYFEEMSNTSDNTHSTDPTYSSDSKDSKNSKNSKHSTTPPTGSSYNSGSNYSYSSKYTSSSGSGFSSNMYQRGLKGLNDYKKLISFLEDMESVDRVLLCADNNNTWTRYHKLLKYS